jgi:hypothetical protein
VAGDKLEEVPMRRLSIAAVAVALALGLAAGAFGQSGVEYAFLNAPYSEAKDFIYTLAAGSFQRAAGLVADDAGPGLSADGLAETWLGLLKNYGNFQGLEVSGADISGDRWTVHVFCSFEKGKVDAAVDFSSLQNQKKVLGVRFTRTNDSRRP